VVGYNTLEELRPNSTVYRPSFIVYRSTPLRIQHHLVLLLPHFWGVTYVPNGAFTVLIARCYTRPVIALARRPYPAVG
jgi:hypothetical protein